MKHIFYSSILALCLTLSIHAQAETRTWTNSKGKNVEGEIISKSTSTVKVKLSTGTTATLKIKDLTSEDQTFIESWEADTAKDQSADKEAKESGADAIGAKSSQADTLKFKWEKSYKSALSKAKEYNLPLMILFTGESWCGYCVKLDNEYLSKKEFTKGMLGQAIGLKIVSASPGQWPAKDKDLVEKFKISGVPAIIYLSPDGTTVLGRSGYLPGSSPEAYAKMAGAQKLKVREGK